LWTQLPEGALKRQLLAEIAEQVQLPGAELSELWEGRRATRPRQDNRRDDAPSPEEGGYADPGYAPGADYGQPAHQPEGGWRPEGGGYGKKRGGWRKNWRDREERPPQGPIRGQPMNRATRALQILFAEPAAWERLSSDEHHLLCELPAPHGALFSWLDSQHHDNGPQPWAALCEALKGHAHEQFVLAEMAKVPPQIESDPDELADILTKERKLRDDEERGRLAARAATDPEAYERLKALLERQKPGAKA
jgi:DNA primase